MVKDCFPVDRMPLVPWALSIKIWWKKKGSDGKYLLQDQKYHIYKSFSQQSNRLWNLLLSFAYYNSEVSFPTVLMDFSTSQNIYRYLTKIHPRCGVDLI